MVARLKLAVDLVFLQIPLEELHSALLLKERVDGFDGDVESFERLLCVFDD